MTNSTEMVIKLEDLPNNRFDESILGHYNNNIEFWKQAEPQYFNNALTKDGLMEFDKFELVEVSDLMNANVVHQKHRVSGVSENYDALRSEIRTNGWKLFHFPPCISTYEGLSSVETGNTRLQIVNSLNITNIIVARFKFADGISIKDQKVAAIEAGQIFQQPPQLHEACKREDLEFALRQQCDEESYPQTYVVDPTDDVEMMNRAVRINQTARFKNDTLLKAIESVRSDIGTSCALAYGPTRAGAKPEELLENWEYKAWGPDVFPEAKSAGEYRILPTSTWDKNFNKALKRAIPEDVNDLPIEQRLVAYLSLNTAADKEKGFQDAAKKIYREFMEWRNAVCDFTGMPKKEFDKLIVFYGMLPGLRKLQDRNDLVRFDMKKKIAWQKNSSYTFSLV